MNGRTHNINVTKFVEKLPINENICIEYSLDENIIDGINHGNPEKILALKYSNNERKIII